MKDPAPPSRTARGDALRAFRLLSRPAGLALAAAFGGPGKDKRAPEQIFLGLTYRCNNACAHCRYAKTDWKRTRGDMPRALALSALEQGRSMGIQRAVFFGGEPLLYKGLEAMVRKACSFGFFTELDTNGALLTPGCVRTLKKAGLASVMISLHGADREEHDRISGRGTFRKALAAIKLCSASGLITYISACVFDGRTQKGMLKRLFTLAAGHGAHGARLLPFAGRKGGTDRASNREILALTRRKTEDGFARTCLLSPSSCKGSRGKIVYVSPSGDVTSCPYSGRIAGNLGQETLSAILARGPGKGTGIFC